MKKVTYLAILLLPITFMSFSCSQDEDASSITLSLEEQYPEWSNLYGEAPAVVEGIPTISIAVIENSGTIEQFLPQIDDSHPVTYAGEFDEIVISGNAFTLKNGGSDIVSGTFTKSGSTINTITTSGRAVTSFLATYTF